MYTQDVLDNPPFQLHIEPDHPIELNDMLRALAAIGHRFEVFAVEEGLSTAKNAKLLITSVKPGSIDIGLLPDYATLGTFLAPAMVYTTPVIKFATAVKGLIDKFKTKSIPDGTTVKECNDAIAIVRPTADNGGTQTFNTYNGTIYQQVFVITPEEAKETLQNAVEYKARIEAADNEIRQRVPFVWYGIDKSDARTEGKQSPDKGIIEEIDPKPRPVFFSDDFASIKKVMLEDISNPYKRVHFVDVAISRVGGRIVSYRVIGYHGADELEADGVE